jgi:hypothetical protein
LNDSLPVLEKKGAQAWMDSLGYGARNDKERFKINSVDSFWLDNSLKVTPDAQLGLIKQLYFGQLPFFKAYQETVKKALIREDNTLYRLGYKTGIGTLKNGNQIGWVLGWIEENNHAYFFVLNLESSAPPENWSTVLVSHVKNMLKGQGFFEGNRLSVTNTIQTINHTRGSCWKFTIGEWSSDTGTNHDHYRHHGHDSHGRANHSLHRSRGRTRTHYRAIHKRGASVTIN